MEYEEFFSRQQAPLLRLCFLVTLDRETAADIAQEAMTRAWHHWPAISGGNPDAWLHTVALNLARSRWKRLRRQARSTLSLQRTSIDETRNLDLLAALRKLPARQREAIVLHYIADLSVEESATTMKISVGAVKQHLSRGRAGLARVLDSPSGVRQ